jgi:hypothetical protein
MSNAVTSKNVTIFPVRHHSPAAALHVQALIAKLKPKIILIEGPSDATDLIPLLLANGTEPPIAILCYFQASGNAAEGEERAGPSSLVSPFCAYSPEYVAMRAGQKVGSMLRFCDIPAGAMLEWRSQPSLPTTPAEAPAGEHTHAPEERAHALEEGAQQFLTPTLETQLARLAEHFDRRDSNEFWDTYFEMSARALNDAAGFSQQMHAYGDLVRDWYEPDESGEPANDEAGETTSDKAAAHAVRPTLGGRQIDFDRFREAFMRTEIRHALAEGYQPEEILVVCGAAHASALTLEGTDFTWDQERVNEAKSAKAATLTLIPYSYARLSEQSGYGAGNRAPAFYQEVWESRGDFAAATRHFLLLAMNALHAKGHTISLADAIEAERLAWTLAAVRDKPAPGLEELEDAARACYGRGGLDTSSVLHPLLIGEALGRLSSKVERTPLQQDFYSSTDRLRIPRADSLKRLDRLYLHKAPDLKSSTLLHRLQVIGVPFATLTQSGRADLDPTRLRHDRAVSQENLGFEHLQSMVEIWDVQWTPHTDIRLIELSIEGDRLRDVCARLLRREVNAAPDIGTLTRILLRAVLANIPELYPRILRRCDEAVAGGSDLLALAKAGDHLHQLAQQGSTRNFDASLVTSLLERIYTRAALLLPAATIVGDDEAANIVEALKLLHSLSRNRKDLDAALLNERLALVADVQGSAENQQDSTVHPTLAGLATTLLLERRAINLDDLAALLGRRLSGAEEPQKGAQFMEGLLKLNKSLLLQSRDIVGWLNHYLQALNSETFLHALPVLRRAMSELSKSEVGILLTTLAGLLGIKETVQEATQLEPAHIAELRAIEASLRLLLMEE